MPSNEPVLDGLARFAAEAPARPAAILAETGETLDYRRLHERSARLACFLAARLEAGEVVAILLGNRLEYFELTFAARRAGLYYVPISTHLTPGEIDYILRDSGARILLTETALRPWAERSAWPAPLEEVLCIDAEDPVEGAASYRALVEADGPVPPLPDRPLGLDFAYSSGTTGRPKGIKHKLEDQQLRKALAGDWLSFFAFDPASVYLSPAPLYHAAPLRFSVRCVAFGGTVVLMRRFDAEGALAAIARWRVTHSQWVPTMFIRLLALPAERRAAHDLSSHRLALHAAAPCPLEVKRRMIDWWGPIVWEYYTGSERAGATAISAPEWLAHPGSVGRAKQGVLHIVGDDGGECAPMVDGLVCFEGGPSFAYHNDPVKTAETHTPQGWGTFGDIGHVDAEGYLYLTDRRANMIISGGVNIYPQEAENLLQDHPLVHEVAVIGVPHAEFGEEVKAVVQLKDPALAGASTAQQLIDHCRAHLSAIKCPRSVDFATDLPRTETGKLLKRVVRDRYRALAAPASQP
ncbi:AMP-binding protein [Variovorax paradoxus]|uniref:AMP-binding protein n=1 Tax=Variovorax paradoxus TaxID=34073 RepID=UPI002479C5AF